MNVEDVRTLVAARMNEADEVLGDARFVKE